MSELLSNRVNRIEASLTTAIDARAKALIKEGKPIINLSAGEPDFDTPDVVKEAAIQSIRDGHTRYTAVDGILELKQAIIEKFHRDNQLSYRPEEIIVTNGAKQSLFNLCLSVLNSGDEVIIPAPYWVSYTAMAKIAGAKPIIISAGIEQNFKITADQLKQAITPKTKLFILNSPSNPSGKVYSAAELKALGDVLKSHPNVLIATDDIYEYIIWANEKFQTLVNVCPELIDRTLVINGVSKAYAMTGWRIGYTAGPELIIKAMKKIQSQNTGNANSIAQRAAIRALQITRPELSDNIQSFKDRVAFFHAGLNALPDIDCASTEGAFYLLPKMTKIIERLGLSNDAELAQSLLEKAQLATVPGSAFGMPGYIRFSCATSKSHLEEALNRLQSYIT